jgi:hypothetical protein
LYNEYHLPVDREQSGCTKEWPYGSWCEDTRTGRPCCLLVRAAAASMLFGATGDGVLAGNAPARLKTAQQSDAELGQFNKCSLTNARDLPGV